MTQRYRYAMFGLAVSSSFPFPFPEFPAAARGPGGSGAAAPVGAHLPVAVNLAGSEEVSDAFSGSSGLSGSLRLGEDERVEVIAGHDGDVVLRYGEKAAFHIAPGGSAVLCGPLEPQALDWRRVLLDTVLGTAALCGGLDALHAGAVELQDRCVVAVTTFTGGGKSTLCAELITRGARLFTDDLLFLTRNGTEILAHPGPPLMNLPRNAAQRSGRLGTRLDTFGDEDWLELPETASASAPLTMVVVLDRRRSADGARLEPEPSPLTLLGSGLDSGPDPDRRRRRFELLAEVTERVPVFRLVAGDNVRPALLAELIEAAVRAPVRA